MKKEHLSLSIDEFLRFSKFSTKKNIEVNVSSLTFTDHPIIPGNITAFLAGRNIHFWCPGWIRFKEVIVEPRWFMAGRKHSKNLWPVPWRQECLHWVSFVQVELTWFKRNKPLAISKVTQSLLLCKLFGNGEVGRWLVLHFWCKTTAHKVLDVQATCWNVNHKNWDQIEHR